MQRGQMRLAGLIALFALSACAAPAPPVRNVVIVTLDTTRADRLSPYGLMQVSMPHLERLAREGIVFDQAISVAPLTLPAHASLFTGLWPGHHGVRDNAGRPLSDTQLTLAEVLQEQGFRTGAFVGSAVLDDDRGLAQGFTTYGGVGYPAAGRHERQRRADAVVSEALDWLSGVGESRFFLWVHLYDPHRPYDAPPHEGEASDPYIAEITFSDAQLGRLLGALEHRGVLDRTLIVVAGDHGESLGEHGERDHGILLYDAVLRVPMMIRAPGLPPGRVGEVVRLIDVAPTVLDLTGVAAPPADGVSLRELMTGRSTGLDLEAYSESTYPERFGWASLRALRDGRYKYIDGPAPELYDLSTDPFEQRNIAAARPAIAAAMKQRIAVIGGADDGHARVATDTPRELRERLSALGYASGAPAAAAARGTLPDPRTCLALFGGVPDGPLPPAGPRGGPCAPVR